MALDVEKFLFAFGLSMDPYDNCRPLRELTITLVAGIPCKEFCEPFFLSFVLGRDP